MKLNQLVNPLSGTKMTLNLQTIVGMVMFILVSLFSVSLAQRIGSRVERHVPAGISSQPTRLFRDEPAAEPKSQLNII